MEWTPEQRARDPEGCALADAYQALGQWGDWSKLEALGHTRPPSPPYDEQQHDRLLRDAADQGRGGGFETIDVMDELYWHIHQGHISTTIIPLGHQCVSDVELEGNQRMLADLPAPFRLAWLTNEKQPRCDGAIVWDGPVGGWTLRRGDNRHAPITPRLRTRQAPLEVGACRAVRVFEHIWTAGAVFRWPYGWDRIMLLAAARWPLIQ